MTTCAALQLVSSTDLEQNLATVSALAEEAAAAGARLLVLPESFALFGDRLAIRELAAREAESADLQQWLAALARRLQVTLIGGTVALASDDGRSWAVSYCVGPGGELLGSYRKVHLFDASVADTTARYRESDEYRPGTQASVIDVGWARVGLAVCYDLRFPALFQHMLDLGVDVIAIPSAFTRTTGLAHWLPLLRARAIECQCLIVGANQGGQHEGGRETSGGSAIVDAWGSVLAEAAFGDAVLVAEWDAQEQAQIRQRMPVTEHRRAFE